MVRVLVAAALLVLSPMTLGAQVADSADHTLRELIDGLPPSARIRVGSSGQHWTGRVAARSSDSLSLTLASGTRTLGLAAIDSLWIRGQQHDALLAGAGFGALMFFLLHAARNTGDRSDTSRLGVILFLGASTGGLLVDAVSERWAQRYPE
jgi:hypothetical protein